SIALLGFERAGAVKGRPSGRRKIAGTGPPAHGAKRTRDAREGWLLEPSLRHSLDQGASVARSYQSSVVLPDVALRLIAVVANSPDDKDVLVCMPRRVLNTTCLHFNSACIESISQLISGSGVLQQRVGSCDDPRKDSRKVNAS